MVRVEVSTDINKPVHEVFTYVRDEDNVPKWDQDLLAVKRTTEGEFGVGTSFHLDIKPFMGQTEGTGEVIGYDPDKKIEFQFKMGKLQPHVWHLFEASGPGTRFTRVVEIEPPGIMKLMSPMMKAQIRKQNVAYLARLKSLVESQG
ncbi:MAG: SRPBCC family protein [Actinomycetota bacterium]|nr:SRPBCC family protein [Actinomycetota bacterium]